MKKIFCLLSLLFTFRAFAQHTVLPKEKLQEIVNKTVDQKLIFGVTVQVYSGDSVWSGSAGNLQNETPYFIASTTKLYTTACILKLRSEGKINFDDKISRFFSAEIMNGLHVYKGVDYSTEITVRHLLSHTSGLPDYFQQKQANGKSFEDDLTAGNDRHWTFEEIIAMSKKMKTQFRPGAKGKAFYSDTNFQLLGRIIEILTGKKLQDAYSEMIFQPLHLTKTYLYSDPADSIPADLNFKNKPLIVPQAMTSFGADGGIVSTAGECMIFLKAFYAGELFPKTYLDEMKNWNRIFYPLESGTGMLRFKLPRIFSPGKAIPELIGHSGLSGAFAFYSPEKNIFITGTVNQISHPDISYKLMAKILVNL